MIRFTGVAVVAGIAESLVGLYAHLPIATIVLFVTITVVALVALAAFTPAVSEPPVSVVSYKAMEIRLQDVSLLKALVQENMTADHLVELFADVVARMSKGFLTASDTDAYINFLLKHEAGQPIPLSSSDIRVVDPPALTNENFRFFAAGVNQVVRLIERLRAEHDVSPEELVQIMLRYAQLRTNEFDDGPLGLHLMINPEAEFRWAEQRLFEMRDLYLIPVA
ncbi:MAG: hypothetical protein RI947_1425 [Candidatus Parcubacteria bacterium]|jgi:hypothetical protein